MPDCTILRRLVSVEKVRILLNNLTSLINCFVVVAHVDVAVDINTSNMARTEIPVVQLLPFGQSCSIDP